MCPSRGGVDAAMDALTQRSVRGPHPSILASRRWTEEPCFDSLAGPTGAAHAQCAKVVGTFIQRHGIGTLIDVFAKVRIENLDDVRRLMDLQQETDAGYGEVGPLARLRENFLLGQDEPIGVSLDVARRLSMERPDDLEAAELYLKLLLFEANAPAAQDIRRELDEAIDSFVRRQGDSALAFVLCLSREGLKIRFAPDFITMHDALARGKAIYNSALELHGDDPEVLVTAAKYGGGRPRAVNLMNRAATLLPDGPVRAGIRQAAVSATSGQTPP